MRADTIIEAISRIDGDLIEEYFAADGKPQKEKAKKPKTVFIKWSAVVAACLVLALCAAIIPQYIPAEYPLDYEIYLKAGWGDTGYPLFGSADDSDRKIHKSNVWLYYVSGGEMERERVRLPRGGKMFLSRGSTLTASGRMLNLKAIM